ncbi:MAG TPA: DUF692 domain-containing protein [Myxococcota bacterium]|nr:DUF692 domain-containing protein [Myxococcota bacterium]
MNRFGLPDLGLGLGLRAQHAREILEHRPPLGFLELLTENHLRQPPRAQAQTEALAAAYPVVLHGVSMNVGSVDPLDREYLREVRALADRLGARWISDHLCWTGVDGWNSHELLPLPYTEEALRHVARRVRQAQDSLGRRLALENPSTYLAFAHSQMPEAEFLARLCDLADCALLLDVNNVAVNAMNRGGDPSAYLAALPRDRVVQIHVAGHSRRGRWWIDTHAAPVAPAVWRLYEEALARFGAVSTLLEWDAAIPSLAALRSELAKAEPIRARAQAAADAA